MSWTGFKGGMFESGAQERIKVIKGQLESLRDFKVLCAHFMEVVANSDQTALECKQELFNALEDHLVVAKTSNVEPEYLEYLQKVRKTLLNEGVKPLDLGNDAAVRHSAK